MAESREIRVMRTMAWEKIKGELQGILSTFWTVKDDDRYANVFFEIDKFITKMDDEGYME